MAQILKDSVKKMIVDSAIKDMFDHGVNRSSMRRIADNAQMTVGNVYRYFKNKDEIVNYIISPVLDRINSIMEKHTGQKIDLVSSTFDWSNVSHDSILLTLDDLAVELVEIYLETPRPLVIMMMHSNINQAITDWFSGLIVSFMKTKNYMTDENVQRCEVLSKSYAVSLFAGVKECLVENKLKKEELVAVIQIFFRGCFMMIDRNFNSVEG